LIEQLADLVIRKPVDEAGLAQERLAAAFDDLAQQSFKILLGPSGPAFLGLRHS